MTPEQIAKLTPEELVTAERWEREREERMVMIERYLAGEITGKEYVAFYRSQAQMCEHGRSIHSVHCFGCDEVERKLYPERFDAEGYRIEPEDP